MMSAGHSSLSHAGGSTGGSINSDNDSASTISAGTIEVARDSTGRIIGTKKGRIWKFFHHVPGEKRETVECKLCQRKVSARPIAMKNHIVLQCDYRQDLPVQYHEDYEIVCEELKHPRKRKRRSNKVDRSGNSSTSKSQKGNHENARRYGQQHSSALHELHNIGHSSFPAQYFTNSNRGNNFSNFEHLKYPYSHYSIDVDHHDFPPFADPEECRIIVQGLSRDIGGFEREIRIDKNLFIRKCTYFKKAMDNCSLGGFRQSKAVDQIKLKIPYPENFLEIILPYILLSQQEQHDFEKQLKIVQVNNIFYTLVNARFLEINEVLCLIHQAIANNIEKFTILEIFNPKFIVEEDLKCIFNDLHSTCGEDITFVRLETLLRWSKNNSAQLLDSLHSGAYIMAIRSAFKNLLCFSQCNDVHGRVKLLHLQEKYPEECEKFISWRDLQAFYEKQFKITKMEDEVVYLVQGAGVSSLNGVYSRGRKASNCQYDYNGCPIYYRKSGRTYFCLYYDGAEKWCLGACLHPSVPNNETKIFYKANAMCGFEVPSSNAWEVDLDGDMPLPTVKATVEYR